MRQNRAKTAVLTHAIHVQRHVTSHLPIEIKQKRLFKSTLLLIGFLLILTMYGSTYKLNTLSTKTHKLNRLMAIYRPLGREGIVLVKKLEATK